MNLIIIIDSGVDENAMLIENIIGGVTIRKEQSDYFIERGKFQDSLGHGTAIFNMIYKECPDEKYYIVKIFGNNFECDAALLEIALDHIAKNFERPIVLIASGAIEIENHLIIESLIEQICEKGGMVISAFSNQGAISYPAAFDAVIGIDTSPSITEKQKYIIVEGSPINVIMREKSYRVKWLHSRNIIEKGNSYAAAEFTSLIIKVQNNCNTNSKKALLSRLSDQKNYSEYIGFDWDSLLHPISNIPYKSIKAIAFPFSKEIQNLAANEDLLNVEIIDYFDIRQSGKVGLKIRDIMTFCDNNKKICNIEKLDWENYNFDLIICGHLDKLNQVVKKDIFEDLLIKCNKHKKSIYSFDYIQTQYKEHYSIPLIKSYTGNTLGKVWNIQSLVVGIYGTSSRQGKFSFQLAMRRKFLAEGFRVAQISTEPTGTLFGMDYTCPIGYNRAIQTSGNDTALFFNEIVHMCDKKNPDIIITGCQSGTIPHNLYSKEYYAFTQYEFLVGTNPDAVILMVNHFDEIDYINRTIQFIESSIDTTVIACVISPVTDYITSNFFTDAEDLSSKINKPVWSYHEAENRIFEQLINSFGGNE